MKFDTRKNIEMTLTLNEDEIISFYKLIGNIRFDTENYVDSFKVDEQVINFLDLLEKYITNDEVYELLDLKSYIRTE